MAQSQSQIDECVAKIPPPAEIKKQLARTLEETSLLRQLLKISEQREKVREVRSK